MTATAQRLADGTSYILVAPASAPGGTYSVSLDAAARGRAVYAGQTAGFPAP